MIRLSARSRAQIARAKKYGAPYEADLSVEAVFERDMMLCHRAVGIPCPCGRKLRTDVAHTADDYATLGHEIALSNGGSHFMSTVFTQAWSCNQQQNHETDTPTRAKNTRRRQKEDAHKAKLTARQNGEEAPAPFRVKQKINSPGFRGSRGMGRHASIKWKTDR